MRNRQWYLNREESDAGKRKRVERDQARTAEIKAGKLSPRSKLTVDHIRPLSKGGTDARGNLRVISGKKNREKFNH
jgi:CRISPR/Cas system Type II protein with McrA/HNH and RuvC-like nuclease domain